MKTSKSPYVLCACIVLALMSCDDSGTSPNGAEAGDSSSSVNLSSSIALASSSSAAVAVSSSSLPVSSSSSAAVSSSSSVETLSSSSVAASYAYTNWAKCVTDGYCGTFSDTRETPAKSYKWVTIGTQNWMAENLAYLPSVNASADYSHTVAKYYVYDYDGTSVNDAKASGNYTTYGVLYNWTAAMAGGTSSTESPSGVQGVCPSGWHLPSAAEWTTLETYAGGSSIAGTSLKATSGWTTGGDTGVDSYRFSALPGGGKYELGFFDAFDYGMWWTATEYDTTTAYYRYMDYGGAFVDSDNNPKDIGFSVRCVQN